MMKRNRGSPQGSFDHPMSDWVSIIDTDQVHMRVILGVRPEGFLYHQWASGGLAMPFTYYMRNTGAGLRGAHQKLFLVRA